MFLKIKKNRGIQVNHNGMSKSLVVDVGSDFLINLAHIGEVSFYSQSEPRERVNLNNRPFTQPPGTKVVHLQMSHTHASFKEDDGRVHQKVYYKLYFSPENVDTYNEIREVFDTRTTNL